MKVAMLIDGWNPPIFGGGQVHVQELCKGLTKNHDCKVDLFVRKLKGDDGKIYNKNTNEGSWHIYRVGPTTKFFNVFGRIFCLVTTTLYLLYKTIKERYDIIHAHAYVSGLPAKIVGFLTKTPIVYTVHGTNGLDSNKKGILTKIEKWLICGIKYDLEISVSKKIFNYKNKNKNIKIIYNGVDLEKYNNIKQPEKYEGINFIWVGRFEWTKGLTYLINGINLIDKEVLEKNDFHLNLIGNGIDFIKIKNLVKEYGLEKFVNFKGKMFGDDLIKEYKKNQIFILPSVTEGQPLTLLEAMACGLPVIVTDVGDNKYFVKNIENGMIINSGNPEKIKSAIIDILGYNQSNLEWIGKNNFNFIKDFDWNIVSEKVYNEYLRLVDSN